jgi:hypothetical protein
MTPIPGDTIGNLSNKNFSTHTHTSSHVHLLFVGFSKYSYSLRLDTTWCMHKYTTTMTFFLIITESYVPDSLKARPKHNLERIGPSYNQCSVRLVVASFILQRVHQFSHEAPVGFLTARELYCTSLPLRSCSRQHGNISEL